MVFWDVTNFIKLKVFWDVTDFMSNTNMGATFQILWTKKHIHVQNGDTGGGGGGGGDNCVSND